MTNAVDTNFSALLQMPAWHFLFYFLKRCTTCVSSKDTREASSSETLLQSVASSAYSMLSSSSSTISVCGVSYFLNLQFSLWLQIFRTQVLHRCEDMLLQEHVLIFMILSQGIKCFSLVLGLGFFWGGRDLFLFFLLVVVNSLWVCSNVDGFGLEAEARMTTWHIMIPSDIEPDGVYNQDVSEGNMRMTKPQMSSNATSVLS